MSENQQLKKYLQKSILKICKQLKKVLSLQKKIKTSITNKI